jgi:uncharacterized membrane protein YfcA
VDILAGFDTPQVAVALASAFGAAFVRGLAGFGLAILLVPVLALALTPVEAVLVTNVVAVCIGLSEIVSITREAERSAWTICVLVILTTAPGLMLLAATPPALARLLIALIALSAFVAMLFPVRPARVPGSGVTIAVGGLSGLLTGYAGMPGPPVVPYYVGRAIPRRIAKASMLLIFTIGAAAGLLSGLAIDVLETRLLWLGLLLLPAVLAGNWLGTQAFGRVSDAVWRSIVAFVLAGAAIAALGRFLTG